MSALRLPTADPDRSEWQERLGQVDPETLAGDFGTPFYVYDLDAVQRQVDALRAILPPSFDLAYAIKANPALAVVAYLGSLGLGADVASGGELELTERARIDPRHVVFTGPGKRDEELAAVVRAGIRAVTVESPGELERLEAISADLGRRTPILLRAAVGPTTRLERVRLVGDDGAGKFGMDGKSLVESAVRASRSPHLELLGLHAFGASNVLDADALAEHVEQTLAAATSLAGRVGFPLRLVDVGGGLGIPYQPHEEPLDLTRLGARLRTLHNALAADPLTRATRVLLEPGRFLVGAAGAYVARVVDRKSVGTSTMVILDGGIHNVLRPALVGQEHRLEVLAPSTGRQEEQARAVTIAGPLCSGLDVFIRDSLMVPPAVGDLVAVLDVGAYGFTEAMPLFLSHPIPAEVAVKGGRAELIRPRVEPRSWLDAQRVPDW
jgi:diaminopimelate decarboxylase